ncbi:MAG: hypothetical protein FWF12_06510 [Betaproteobacteria bacterium]|nr:hypothetical protein [Betaproteobacteria bacterium]
MLGIAQSVIKAVVSCVAAVFLISGLPARAEPMHFTGNFINHNDVVSIPFTLTEEAEGFISGRTRSWEV